MTARIFIKLIVGVLCVLIVALAAVDLLVSRLAEDNYLEQRRLDLKQKALTLAELSDNGFADFPRERFVHLAEQMGGRLTVIARDGRVLADSEGLASEMDSHANRPEIRAAIDGEIGMSTRMSPTVGVMSQYVAVPIPVGVLRTSVPLSHIQERMTALRKETLLSMVYAFIPAMLVAAFFARAVSSRLGRIIEFAGQLADGGFRRRLGWEGRNEMALLAAKLDETAEKLEYSFDALNREHGKLERQEQIRKDFVINVSHELRTPLASIQGYTETLLNGAINDPEHNIRFLNIIRRNAERLGNLTKDLLALSSIELKLQKMRFASCFVNLLLAESVDSLRPLADRKRIAIEIVPAPEGVEAFCDSEATCQALTNLLDNAIKYTPEGGKIRLSATVIAPTEAEGSEFVEIAVQDSGQGLLKKEQPRLFERFYRVDKARSRELGGTGLGLAIVKHLARAMGGSVRVQSEYGHGATFAFTVPVRDLGLAEESDVQPSVMNS